ncbi:GON-4-like protein isoform X4 [Chelmon rostratus]|uniref:GON-4-like protein isoform X4 n=1 Tax=Chelmon rostratus TaxID=109905 RepID=UPI001BEA103D|nr:GON-4-like protein isoform X4 [Chelmon rostratus]
MNPVRKCLKLCPSRPACAATAARGSRPPRSSPQLFSHDALLLPPPAAPAGGGAEEEGYLLVEEDTTDSSLIITMEDSQVEVKTARRKAVRKRKRKLTEEEGEGGASESEEEEAGVEVEIDRQLDQSLETKSKQHNLTTVNVRNIIHEVITNEHVVAMMKAAINETEAVPPFEPKMTRSKFKEVVEKGVVIPAWNISPIKKTSDANKTPQFVDIPLAEEDSSDEEYRPDEEDEDETAEDTFQESDMESTASSPRGSRLNRVEDDSCSPWQTSRRRSRCLRAGSGSMGPPPPPKAPPPKAVTDSTFLEKLHAVEEELAVCMEPYQPLSESEEEVGLMAYRTRSKRPLRDVPLGRLEAELRAPDITPDMYDSSSAHEDRDWTDWLRGLMTSEMDNDEECDDEDDPEYNFLADIDEPDQEDYRDDKAVRITKKEVNELMEELFETLKEDLAGQEVEDEGHEEEEEPQEETCTVQTDTPEVQHNKRAGDDEVEDGPITELRTVKQQLALMRKKRQLGLLTDTICNSSSPEPYTLKLDGRQRTRLQQQLQQHVQLLTQIHLLSSPVAKLHSEAETTRQFLFELDLLAQRGELLMSSGRPGFRSIFRASNLQGALRLLEELWQTPISYQPQHHPPDARGYMRCYPVMPAELAWLFATRPVFLYPELLPCASLDPALYCPRRTAAFTAAEDCLLVLGLRNMEGSCDPTKLVSQFLLRKTLVQVRRRILQCCRPGFPDNIVKAFRYQRVLWPMLVACRHVDLAEQRPPVEREERVMPLWLVVCDAVQVSPGLSEQLLQVLDQFSAAGPSGAPEVLYIRLSCVLRPWPQLLRDFAAFLNRGQARRCGLLSEQQLFERSRRFLRRMRRSLGEGSTLYQQVVSVLQGSATPPPEDMDKISSLLKRHPHLRDEFREFFQQLHVQSSPIATSRETTETNCMSQNPPDGNRKRVDRQTSEESQTGSDREEEEESERPVCAKNISTTSTGEKVVIWTREADRAILTACQQRGANRKTFRHVSAQLGNKTAKQVRGGGASVLRCRRSVRTSLFVCKYSCFLQVSLRFHALMNLFHSAFQKSTSCSSEGRQISTQEAALH